MLNINAGHNEVLLQKCKELGAYSAYISRVHSNIADGMSKDEAINEAVEFAIKENLLNGYFAEKKMEVLNMSLYEFNKDEYDRHRREEGRKEGREEGILQKAISTAKAMLARQLGPDIISDCTGLPLEEVMKLKVRYTPPTAEHSPTKAAL